jgi:hypothetical protein
MLTSFRLPALCAALIMAFASSGQTQVQTQAAAPQDWSAQEITVVGRLPGPALWKLKSATSEVYVLGAMPVMVKRAQWDMSRIERIMGSADLFLTRPEGRIGPIAVATLMAKKNLGFGHKLSTELPPDLSRRFFKMVSANGFDPKRYEKDLPIWAAMKLRDDIYDKTNLSVTDPEKVLQRMAKAKGVKMQPMSTYSAASMLGKITGYSRGEQMACVANILNEIDFTAQYTKYATDFWGAGNLKGVHDYSVNSATIACLEGDPSTAGMVQKTIDDTVETLSGALKTPGKTLIVLPMDALLRKGGALEQLRAKGVEISEPAE